MIDLAKDLEAFRGWLSTGALYGILFLVLRFSKPILEYLAKRGEQRLQEKREDRQGYGGLIETLNAQLAAQAADLERLKIGRDRDHRIILYLLNQVNRGQIGAILHDVGEDGISPEIRSMFDSLMSMDPVAQAGGNQVTTIGAEQRA